MKNNLLHKTKNLIKHLRTRNIKILLRNFYVVFLLVIAFFTFYHIGYARRIIPGVKIGEVFVGGMTYEDALNAVTEYEKNLDKKVILETDGATFEFSDSDIELIYDLESTVSRAFELGRSRNFFVDTKDKLASLIKTIRVKAYYDLNDDALSNEFAKVRGSLNVDSQNAKFVLENGTLVTLGSSSGKSVDNQKMYDDVIASFENMLFRKNMLKVDVIEPELTKEDMDLVYGQVNSIVFDSLTIKYDDKTWTLTNDQLLDFVDVHDGDKVEVGIDKTKLEAYVDMIAQQINRLPRGTVTNVENGVVTGFELIRDGREVDLNKFSEDFKTAFFNEPDEVTVPINKIENLDDPSKYGILSLLGEGSSTYIGSANERIHNLTLAAARTDGVLVPPGEVYSFNNSVGEISANTGYDTAYIISNGRTVLGEGGGVCQTSTTLFRAVLNSGLPVVTRHPHAYRVGYYEQDRKVGFDASVYQPSLDFQFKNDTPNYVLVQSSWDLNENSLSFKIYGTPDSRQVSISEPVVTNVSAPPEPLYQETDTLKKGVTKQVDWAAWGAHVYFTRTVTRGDEVLYEDTFSSSYQPWKAVYLVGTKET